ncbi:MAG: hypothetical protein Q9227_000687 [Pyrenula ochraceoflavens]
MVLADASSVASKVAKEFLSKHGSREPLIRKHLLDQNQLRLLALTLNREHLHKPGLKANLEHSPPKHRTPVPPCYHLAYFTAPFLENTLGYDGTDKSFNPRAPFTRRMWAGGSVSWPGAKDGNYLRVGDKISETTKVLSSEPKVIEKTGEPMLVVGVEKTFETTKGVAVVERRDWVFREAFDPENPPKIEPRPAAKNEEELLQGDNVRKFCQTPVSLFRFSALTFNAHKIHYSEPWCQQVEGHRTTVVHGPLNLINMLDLWRDMRGDEPGLYPKKISYRATSPVYMGEGYRIIVEPDKDKDNLVECRVVSDDGTLCMRGEIERWADGEAVLDNTVDEKPS